MTIQCFIIKFLDEDSVLIRNYEDEEVSSEGSTCSATGEHRCRTKCHLSDSHYAQYQNDDTFLSTTIKGTLIRL